jgi:hypothetical protein
MFFGFTFEFCVIKNELEVFLEFACMKVQN